MADTKIVDLPELAAIPAADDLIEIIDTSDTTDSAEGSNKYIAISNILAINSLRDALASATIDVSTFTFAINGSDASSNVVFEVQVTNNPTFKVAHSGTGPQITVGDYDTTESVVIGGYSLNIISVGISIASPTTGGTIAVGDTTNTDTVNIYAVDQIAIGLPADGVLSLTAATVQIYGSTSNSAIEIGLANVDTVDISAEVDVTITTPEVVINSPNITQNHSDASFSQNDGTNVVSLSISSVDDYAALSANCPIQVISSSDITLISNGESLVFSSSFETFNITFTGYLNLLSSVAAVNVDAATSVNIGTGTASAVLIGGATTEIGLYGATPVAQQTATADPTGGIVVDDEARAAISDIIAKLKLLGVYAP